MEIGCWVRVESVGIQTRPVKDMGRRGEGFGGTVLAAALTAACFSHGCGVCRSRDVGTHLTLAASSAPVWISLPCFPCAQRRVHTDYWAVCV